MDANSQLSGILAGSSGSLVLAFLTFNLTFDPQPQQPFTSTMAPSPSATPKRTQAFKRSAPSDGFPASPVPSKLRNPRGGTPRQSIAQPASPAVAKLGSTIGRRTRGGSRLTSVASTNGYTDGLPYDRHGSVGLGSVTSDFAPRYQHAPRHGLARGAVLAKDQVYKVFATGDVPVDVWNVLQAFSEF